MSVGAQTHPSWELLLCDDGSTDASTSMALKWAGYNPTKVRYLEHEGHAHRGMSSSRNLGIRAARGELVAFLDADDVWEPDHLSHEVALLLDHPEAGLICGQCVDWYSWADPEAEDIQYPLPWPPGVVVPPPEMLIASLRHKAFRTPMCNLMVWKRVLESVGGFEDQFRELYEDQVILAKLFLSHKAVISGTRTARYRKHPGSSTARAMRSGLSHTGPNVTREAFLRWLNSLPQVRAPNGNEEIRLLLHRAMKPYDRKLLRSRWRTLSAVRTAIPPQFRPFLRAAVRRAGSLGLARMGYLRRLSPLSRQFGSDRGLPVDRYFVERFLAENAHLITGHVLEVGNSEYTRRFGGHRVTLADVLNIEPGHPETTIVADLADADHIPASTFDCLVITQTLQFVYDLAAAVQTLHRILRPGGTLLATFPGISPISNDRWAAMWYWSLTPLAAVRLFSQAFGVDNVDVSSCGNVLTSVAFLEGMAAHELRRRELDARDPQFPMLVTVRAFRPRP